MKVIPFLHTFVVDSRNYGALRVLCSSRKAGKFDISCACMIGIREVV